jgi:hypothetical protein
VPLVPDDDAWPEELSPLVPEDEAPDDEAPLEDDSPLVPDDDLPDDDLPEDPDDDPLLSEPACTRWCVAGGFAEAVSASTAATAPAAAIRPVVIATTPMVFLPSIANSPDSSWVDQETTSLVSDARDVGGPLEIR